MSMELARLRYARFPHPGRSRLYRSRYHVQPVMSDQRGRRGGKLFTSGIVGVRGELHEQLVSGTVSTLPSSQMKRPG